MAWLGTHGRNERGTWCQLTKPLTTQVVVVVVKKDIDDEKCIIFYFGAGTRQNIVLDYVVIEPSSLHEKKVTYGSPQYRYN